MDVHPTTVVLLQSLLFLLQPLKQAPAGLPAPSSPRPALLPRRPHRPTVLPSLAQPSLYSPTPVVILRQRQTNKKTLVQSYSPPRGKQLPSLPWLRVVPFIGLAVVHRPGALGAAWSTWSMNDIHRKWTVRGEADSWVHGRTQENASLLRAK